MASSPVREIVERVLEASAGNLAEAGMTNAQFKEIKKDCKALLAAYNQYQQDFSEYQLLVKDKAKLKRQIKKYSAQGIERLDLSAQLADVKRQQEQMQAEQNLLAKAKTDLTAIYRCVFHLQTAVNRLLGQSISMAYVSQRSGTTQVVKLDREVVNDMYVVDIDRYGNYVLRYNIAAIEWGIKDLDEEQKKKKIITSKISTGMQTLMENIQERMRIASAHNSTKLLWKANGEWKQTDLSNFGDILEAYTNMLINGDEHALSALDSVTGDVDMAIDILVTQYLSQVTTQSGFFQEDVQVENTNQYFGIKSAGASLMGFKLIVQFAQLIQDTVETGAIDAKRVTSLTRRFKGSSKIRHAVETVVENEGTLAIEQEIEKMAQSMSRK